MIDALAFSVIILGLISIGLFRNRAIQSESTYLFADRKAGFFSLTCTLVMTELNTATLLAFSGLGFLVGMRALSLPLIFLIGLIFYALTVAKKWKELDGESVVLLFRLRYGKTLGQMASFSLLLAMFGFTAIYVKSITLIFAPIFSLNFWVLSGILIALTLLMTLRGGLIAIIRTDVISFIFVLMIFPLLLFFSMKNGKAPTQTPALLPTRYVISLVILTMFTYILAPWYGQKIFSARSKKVAFASVFVAAFLVFIFYSVAILATAYMGGVSLSSPDKAFPHLVSLMPAGIRGATYALLFMIASTTLAGVWSAMSTMVIADFWKGKRELSYKCPFVITLFIALVSYLLGNTLIDRILDKMILANIPVAALSFALLGGFYWKKTTRIGAYISIIVGMGVGLGSYLTFGEEGMYTWYWAIYGIPLIFISGIVGSVLTQPLVDQVGNKTTPSRLV